MALQEQHEELFLAEQQALIIPTVNLEISQKLSLVLWNMQGTVPCNDEMFQI